MDAASLKDILNTAMESRKELIEELEAEQTDTYRLFHGAVEGLPGLVVDRYGRHVLIQTFRQTLAPEEIQTVVDTVCAHLDERPAFFYNDRSGKSFMNIPIDGEPDPRVPMVCKEMGVKFRVMARHGGQDPLLFVDFRAGRRFVREHCKGKSVLNLFAYTCGMGVSAAAAGAQEVWNVDFSSSYLAIGKENARLNEISLERFRFLPQDVFPVIRQLSGQGVKGKSRRRRFMNFKPRQFDMVILDPPTWAKSAFGAVDIVNDYQSLFKPALLCVKPGGRIICTNHAHEVERDEWVNQLQRCAEKNEIDLAETQTIQPEKDFPTPDNKSPLKIVVFKREDKK